MDMRALQRRMGLAADREVVPKAEELLRMCKMQFDAAAFGIGDLCKSVLCYELACLLLQVPFDRQKGIKLSGLSEKAYNRSLNTVQNALGIRSNLDVRELAVQFGCVRLIQAVHRALATYKQRFVAALPEGRRKSADFGRPVFTAVAFFLCARKHKLKVDRAKLMEMSSTSDPEFSNVATSMTDVCFDILGIEKEKKDPRQAKGNRALLDALPSTRALEEGEHSDSESDLQDDDDGEVIGRKRCRDYEVWKETILASKESSKASPSSAIKKQRTQTRLNFKRVSPAQPLQVPA